ncbi:hypothetical protein [Nocardia sp. NPDC050710]|uniref:hypothetical protein n=1 Tax=Nocardia sp. NPDC050710 TaxID=3157220 RepID=UPI0033D0ACF3
MSESDRPGFWPDWLPDQVPPDEATIPAADGAFAAWAAAAGVGPGAWSGNVDGVEFNLDATDNRAVTRYWQDAKWQRLQFDLMMRRMAGSLGPLGGRLAGLQYSLKDLESLRRKIAGEMRDSDGNVVKSAATALAENNDVTRYTITLPADDYVEGSKAGLNWLNRNENKVPPKAFKNFWGNAKYKGFNTTWESLRFGRLFEVQFHTPEGFAAKSVTHPIYELERTGALAEELGDPARAKAATDFMQNRAYDNVKIPRGPLRLLPGWRGDTSVPTPPPNDVAVAQRMLDASNEAVVEKPSLTTRIANSQVGQMADRAVNSVPGQLATKVIDAPSHYGTQVGEALAPKVAPVVQPVANSTVVNKITNNSVVNKVGNVLDSTGGRAAGKALGAAGVGLAVYNDIKEGDSVGKAVTREGLGLGAAIATGAAVGTMIPVPVVGTVVGAATGAVVGIAVSKGVDKAWDPVKNGAKKVWNKLFNTGGFVSGPGTSTSDDIFARLSNGEFVMNAAATAKNLPLLQLLNSGWVPSPELLHQMVPGFSSGGPVGIDPAQLQGFREYFDSILKTPKLTLDPAILGQGAKTLELPMTMEQPSEPTEVPENQTPKVKWEGLDQSELAKSGLQGVISGAEQGGLVKALTGGISGLASSAGGQIGAAIGTAIAPALGPAGIIAPAIGSVLGSMVGGKAADLVTKPIEYAANTAKELVGSGFGLLDLAEGPGGYTPRQDIYNFNGMDPKSVAIAVERVHRRRSLAQQRGGGLGR